MNINPGRFNTFIIGRDCNIRAAKRTASSGYSHCGDLRPAKDKPGQHII